MKTFTICLSVLIFAAGELEALTCKEIKAFVDGHNQRRNQLARGMVRGQPAASNMKYMLWDNELQAKAEKWAAKNRHQHNPDKTIRSGRFRTGENLYWYGVTNRNYKLNPDQALESWFNEHKNFTFKALSASDFDGSKDYQVGHYTQMAWADTVFVGCAIAESAKGRWKKFFVVCNYGPAGNFLGQTPYKAGRNNPNLICDCTKYENCDCERPYGITCSND